LKKDEPRARRKNGSLPGRANRSAKNQKNSLLMARRHHVSQSVLSKTARI
jgi:hypothetical protein